MGSIGDNFKSMVKGAEPPGMAEEPEAVDNAAEETDEQRSTRIGSNLGKYLHPKKAGRLDAVNTKKVPPGPGEDTIRKPTDFIGSRG